MKGPAWGVMFEKMMDDSGVRLPTRFGARLIATNIAFRGGVLGRRVKVEPTQAFLDALASMTVVMTEDRSGK